MAWRPSSLKASTDFKCFLPLKPPKISSLSSTRWTALEGHKPCLCLKNSPGSSYLKLLR